MPWGAIVGGVIAGAGSMIGGSEQASAASDAANTNLQEFNTITQQESPFMQSGYGGLQELDYLLGITPTSASGASPSAASPYASYMPSDGGIPGTVNDMLSRHGNPNGWNNGSISGIQQSSEGMGGLGGSGMPVGRPVPSSGSPGGGFGSLVSPFTMQDWQQLSPMYNFQLQQGQQGVLNAEAGSQGALSGAALKDLISFNQGTANQSFNNAFNLYQQQQGNIFNRLMSVTGLGQTAAANTGAQGTTLAGNIGSAQIAGGNAMGTGIQNAGNILGGTANALAAYQALGQDSGPVTTHYPTGGGGEGGTLDAGGGYTFTY
jgi:hypothetical protein